jgi:glycosyltransferase involved in cell wall biosynthesis
MASKIPVIASRIGGIPELVDNGVTGLLFEAGDASDLAIKMTELLAHPERVRTFGEAAFRKISGLSFEDQVGKILQVYEGKKHCNVQKRENVVVCAGRRVDPACALAMDAFANQRDEHACAFIMADWVDEDIVSGAALLWVVDGEAEFGQVPDLLRHGLPLLVPESNGKLRDLCSLTNCGLYYGDAQEAEVCLDYLLRNREEAEVMGRNGLAFHSAYVKSVPF